MRPILSCALVLLVACQDAGGEKDPSTTLQKTRAKLDRAKAELRDVKQKLVDAKAQLDQARAAKKQLAGGEQGEEGSLPPVGNAIRCQTRESCTVERSYFDAVMAAPFGLLDQMRIMPWQKGGQMRGIKLFGIDEGTIPAALGLEGGDIVVAIGGQALSSLNDVMSLGHRLGISRHYELDLDRDGDVFTLSIQIVDSPAPAEQP